MGLLCHKTAIFEIIKPKYFDKALHEHNGKNKISNHMDFTSFGKGSRKTYFSLSFPQIVLLSEGMPFPSAVFFLLSCLTNVVDTKVKS